MADARNVIEQYRVLAAKGESWAEIDGRVIDQHEARRARELLDWDEIVRARDQEKAEAVARAGGTD